ncbi:MAG: hypothetical protein ACLPKI_21565 [Streptosporangiaceae bacterium]
MTRTEQRLADALAAAARAVPEESLRPLVAPERRERGQRRLGRPDQPRRAGWPGWLAPVAAALGVALVIGLAVLASRLSGPSAGPAAGLPPGVPRYYVETGLSGRPVVRSTATGRVTSTVPVPPGNATGYNLTTADDNGTFFAVAFPPGGNQGERLYKFRLTAAGRVAAFSAVPGGALANRDWAADALSVSPDGSRIAVAMSFTPRVQTCAGRQAVCARPHPDYILAISLATGARTVWRYTGDSSPHLFTVDSLSWTSDNRQLVYLGQACRSVLLHETCLGPLRTAEVRALNPATGGGLGSGRLLLRESARFPYLAQALISPDGATITAVVLHGRVAGNPGLGSTVPRDLTVTTFSAATGQPLSVVYQRRLDGTAGASTVPAFLALGQDASGQHFLLNIGLCVRDNCSAGASGWIHGGRLVPLPPAAGRDADEVW